MTRGVYERSPEHREKLRQAKTGHEQPWHPTPEQRYLSDAIEQFIAARARGDIIRVAIAEQEIQQALYPYGLSREQRILHDIFRDEPA